MGHVIFLLILRQVEGNLIYPRVVGAKIILPAILVLAAVTVGGNQAGPLGMFLGVPAASAAYTLIREATDQRARKHSSAIPPLIPAADGKAQGFWFHSSHQEFCNLEGFFCEGFQGICDRLYLMYCRIDRWYFAAA